MADQQPTAIDRVTLPICLPTNMLICGETHSGKTMLIDRLIRHSQEMFTPPPKGVVVCYKMYQPIYDVWTAKYDNVTCVPGIDEDYLKSFPRDNNKLLIFDDLMKYVWAIP
jgi:GTPase SAR1 family protein